MSYGYGPQPSSSLSGRSGRCSACGGVATNPQDTQCRFCGAMLHAAPPPQQQPQAYYPQAQAQAQAQPQAQAQGYYPPSQAQGYYPPSPPQPYGGYPPVQSFGGNYGQYVNRGAFGSGMSTIFWIRIAVVGVVVALSMMGACVSAITNN